MTIQFRGGRLSPRSESDAPRLKLASFLTSAAYPPAPAQLDYLSQVVDWPMYGNDQWGDCVWAMIGHTIEAATTYGQGMTVKVSEEAVLKGYSDVTGFDPAAGPPGDNPTDQGTVIQDALNYWRKVGVGGHKILAFAQVDHTNLNEVKAALALFGHLQLGINFPDTAMDQFNEGRPWDVVPHSHIEGGHAINLGSYYKAVTWAQVQEMTPAFWDTYVEEAWIAITPEWVRDNKNPEGLDTASVNQAFHDMTGQPGPFPVVQPDDPPVPPAPAPEHDTADAALNDALVAWQTAKGFVKE